MRILLIDNVVGAADSVERKLTAAGHSVMRCQRPEDADKECVFLRGASLCPLHAAPVDAVVDVRRQAADGTTSSSVRELGAVCAVQDHVPLVVIGSADVTVLPWSRASVVCQAEDIAGRCPSAEG
jgi:hypothetical protein